MVSNNTVIESVQRWVESFVIELNLCPFAKREFVNNRIRYTLVETEQESCLLDSVLSEIELLAKDESVETTLLVHPNVLQDFDVYNQFLNSIDYLLEREGYEGVFQVASFHPHYQFAGTHQNDAENYTNRSPYPMLHILREKSLEAAIEHYPDVHAIPDRNIALMDSLGSDKLKLLMSAFVTG